jgi:lipoprotein-anchoring transpeptidase ErfK/SrfK
VTQTTRATSKGTPLRWAITCDVTARCLCSSFAGTRLITNLDDGDDVKLGPAVLLLAAALAAAPATAVSAARVEGHCRAGVLHPVGTRTAAYAATLKTRTRTYRRPGAAPLATFARLNRNRYPTTFSIVGAIVNGSCRASWYRVKLPMRPNGVTGYVRPSEVIVQEVATRIVVDLSVRRLSFYRAGRLVLTAPVAVGSPSTPTPVGRFYVDQRILVTDAKGPYGPAALGVSAFSDVLTGWAQGGPIAIHGTNQPWSIGRAVSNGCIRMSNPTLKKIFVASLSGTPVVIHR